MMLEPRWTASARRALQQLGPKDAAAVDAAVLRFASGSKGAAYRLPEDEATTVRLPIGDYRVRMIVNIAARVLWIVMVYRVDR